MDKLFNILSTLVIFLIISVNCSEKTLVEIDQGKILGKLVQSISKKSVYYSFKGIPYAKPPVENLKFMPPEEHEGWEGTFKAFDHGDFCIQSYEFSDDGTGSEDCLFLNVFTPKIKKNFNENDTPYPVMFFVHGGSFRYGSGNTTIFGPDYFMDENVILVTINYRLGTHGFLDMENDVVSGNMGLKDVLLALKWVRNNIAMFGGDTDNITIFGQGSGAMMVDILYLSPVTKGMFHRAILQSGTALDSTLFDWSPKSRAYNLTIHLKDEGHDDKSVLRALKEAKPLSLPGNIMRTLHPDETIFKQIALEIFSPTLNNKSEPLFLSKLPEDLMEDGDLPNKDVPIMIGFNSQESLYDNRFFARRPEFIKNLNKRFPFTLPFRGIHAEFDSDAYHSLHYRILWFYFNVTVDITKESILNEYLSYHTDLRFLPLDQSVKTYAELNTAPVYYYQFDYIGELNYFRKKALKSPFPLYYPADGASEKDELCYLFKCNIMRSKYEQLHAKELEETVKDGEGEEQKDMDLLTLRKMVRLWTNFAKTGNPTPSNDEILEGLDWKPVSTEETNYLNIGDEFTMEQDPRLQNVLFWEAMYEYYTPLANEDGILKDIPLETEGTENDDEQNSTENLEDNENIEENQEQIPKSKNETKNKDEL